MAWAATIKVVFTEDVDDLNNAEWQANMCMTVLQEQNTLNPNQLASVDLLSLKEQ